MPSCELALHDIDAGRLATPNAGAPHHRADRRRRDRDLVSSTARAALDGADYVINEIQVGGYPATRLDFDIPARYGVRQTIADTLGIGGIFRGLRTIPVLIGIGRDIAELCPDAYLLNYTNPMAMLPWAVYAGTPFQRVFGLCHSVRDTHAFLAGLVGLDPGEVSFTTAGFNHQAFVLRFEHEGRSLYPRLREIIEADPELQRRVRVELFRRFGYFPTESSEHSAEYVPWFMRHDDQIERFRIFVGDYLAASEENLRELESLRRASRRRASRSTWSPPTSSPRSSSTRSDRHRARALRQRAQRRADRQPARRRAASRSPATWRARRAARPVGALPAQLAALNRTFLNVVELTVRAVLDGSRDTSTRRRCSTRTPPPR